MTMAIQTTTVPTAPSVITELFNITLGSAFPLYNMSNDSYSCTEEYINVTCESPPKFAVPLYGYVMPYLLVITIIANTLIVVVLSKRHMRTPTNVVLMAMALCDMFTLLLPAPWLIYMYTFGNHYKPLYPVSLCYAWNTMHEVSTGIYILTFLMKSNAQRMVNTVKTYLKQYLTTFNVIYVNKKHVLERDMILFHSRLPVSSFVFS